MRQCCGITRNLNRCNRIGEWKFFCREHRRQPLVWLVFIIFTVSAGAASIYSALQPSRAEIHYLPAPRAIESNVHATVASKSKPFTRVYSNSYIEEADQPKLSIRAVNKPYLRYEVIDNNKIAFSYELSISNLGKNNAINISYSHIIQKLVVSDKTVVHVDSLAGTDNQPSKSGYSAPAKVVSGDRYFQIFMLNGNNLNSSQINNLIDKYQKEHLAIILDIGIKYTDAITHKEYETTEILKFFKNKDEILSKRL